MNRTDALDMVKYSISRAVPGAHISALGPDDVFRDVLEMDSLDFLSFIESLSERSGIRIDDEDTIHLTTLSASVDFLLANSRPAR